MKLSLEVENIFSMNRTAFSQGASSPAA